MRELLLTLGHNSSAILVEDGKIAWGYETERISGIKSDSQFPLNEITALDIDRAYVTHWHPSGVLANNKLKHWVPDALEGVPIATLSPDMSHHDTHAYGALWFAGPEFPRRNTVILVVDGFGIHGEHFSAYRVSDTGRPILIKRIRGYHTSLGLMYQYATAFMGMKMHEDEYKLLGYEVHINKLNIYQNMLYRQIADQVDQWEESTGQSLLYNEFDPLYNLEALEAVKQLWFNKLSAVMRVHGFDDPTSPDCRILLAHYVQRVLERCVMRVLEQCGMFENILVAGGCFYNVKLNFELLMITPDKFCAYPLAGDQGNALGLYYAYNPNFKFPGYMNWGKRRLSNVGLVEGLHYTSSEGEAVDMMEELINRNGMVNLVRGDMEFGPRALCNTSTLAVPRLDVVEAINKANNRNTYMPMAPVMTANFWREHFEACDNVHRSEEYMIVAQQYRKAPIGCLGAAHPYAKPYKHYTGRPQVIHPDKDPVLEQLLARFGGVLINTSFNYHGNPIAFDMPSIIQNHQLQRQKDPSINTIVITQ